MIQLSEFRNKELAFLNAERINPKRGYQIVDSKNYVELQKILGIQNKEYNSYVTIATYKEVPRFSLNPKIHWPEFKEWIKIRDQTITSLDFILDFDSEPTIKGLKKAWKDVIMAKYVLKILLGDQANYLKIWFSGNKGFHILGKTKITTNAQDNINQQLIIAQQVKHLCPTLDMTIYDTARLRKLLGSYVYSKTFGRTRVIPVQDEQEFKELIKALEHKNEQWFQSKELIRINYINMMGENK